MNSSFFSELMQTITERGRALIDRAGSRRESSSARADTLIELCEDLLSRRGEDALNRRTVRLADFQKPRGQKEAFALQPLQVGPKLVGSAQKRHVVGMF